MYLDLIRLLLDFGLLVLIWMIQLVVYPGLCHYNNPQLDAWHKIYKARIAVIVAPLMLAQLAVIAVQFYLEQNLFTWLSLGLVLTIWLLTFLIFVPLHNAIVPNRSCREITDKLVLKNWWRTFLWSLLFLLSLFSKISGFNF